MELAKYYGPLELKFYNLCSPVIRDLHLEIYDLEFLSEENLLRLFLVREKGAEGRFETTIEDCIRVDRALGEPLSNESAEFSWVPEGLTPEVSSPGLERKLRRSDHFQDAQGLDVSLYLKEGGKREISILEGPGKEEGSKNLSFPKKWDVSLESTKEDEFIVCYEKDRYKVGIEAISYAQIRPNWQKVMKGT